MDLDGFFNSQHRVYTFRNGEISPALSSILGKASRQRDALTPEEAVWSTHKERQRDEKEDDALSLSDRAALKKAMDKQCIIQALKDRREKLRELIDQCNEYVVGSSHRANIEFTLKDEIKNINLELGELT